MSGELLTRVQAAERLGISLATLDAERIAGNLAYIQRKKCGKVWITERAIQEYLARATHDARPARQPITNTYRKRRK